MRHRDVIFVVLVALVVFVGYEELAMLRQYARRTIVGPTPSHLTRWAGGGPAEARPVVGTSAASSSSSSSSGEDDVVLPSPEPGTPRGHGEGDVASDVASDVAPDVAPAVRSRAAARVPEDGTGLDDAAPERRSVSGDVAAAGHADVARRGGTNGNAPRADHRPEEVPSSHVASSKDGTGAVPENDGGGVWVSGVARALKTTTLRRTSARVGRTSWSKRAPREACPKSACGDRGVCVADTGACRCSLGWTGAACDLPDPQPCNDPTVNGSHFFQSQCAGVCDTTGNKCVCGPGTPDPGRSMYECRYDEAERDWPEYGDWPATWHSAPRERVLPSAMAETLAAGKKPATLSVHGTPPPSFLTKNDPDPPTSPEKGASSWCDASPAATARNTAEFVGCTCYEGRSGALCSTPTKQYCLNDCAGKGRCESGFCQCDEGAHGADCSEDAEGRVAFERGATALGVPVRYSGSVAGHAGMAAEAPPPWPRIYVYDLPPRFNVGQLQQRLKKARCTWRYYDDGLSNETRWEPNLYGAESLTHELLLASPHRTSDPTEADYFFLPVYAFCFISRLLAPIPKHHERLRTPTPPGYPDEIGAGSATLRATVLYQEAIDHVARAYPFWNASGGADHIVPMFHDEGACYAPQAAANATFLVHWGRTTRLPLDSTSYGLHRWARPGIHDKWRPKLLAGNDRCFRPEKDVVLPAYRSPDQVVNSPFLAGPTGSAGSAQGSIAPRRFLVYFRGMIRPEDDRYSLGIRQALWRHLNGREGEGIVFTEERSERYRDELADADFCPVVPGDGWSARMEDSVVAGCIPVIIQDEIYAPWEGWLDVSAFSIRVSSADAASLVETLRAVPLETRAKLREGLARVWGRYVWSGAFRAENARCEAGAVRCTDVGLAAGKARGPDAFDTLVEVLAAKLSARGGEEEEKEEEEDGARGLGTSGWSDTHRRAAAVEADETHEETVSRTEGSEDAVAEEAAREPVGEEKGSEEAATAPSFSAFEREEQRRSLGSLAADDGVEEWLDQWSCLPDDEHGYPGAPHADHCDVMDEALPRWYARDPHVEALVASGVAGRATHGLELAALLAGKRVLVQGDSIVEQLYASLRCDVRRVLGTEHAARTAEDEASAGEWRDYVLANYGKRMVYVSPDALAEGMAKLRKARGGGGSAGETDTASDVDDARGAVRMFLRGDRTLGEWSRAEVGPLREMLTHLDVVIIHVGLHYDQSAAGMREDFERVMPELNAFASQPGKAVLMMEVGSQHFPGSSHGAYEDRNKGALAEKGCHCAPVDDAAELTSHRNAVVRDAMEKYPAVKLIPFRALTGPRFATHFKRRVLANNAHVDAAACDCSHWCYSAPFWRTVLGSVRDALGASL